MLLNYLKIAFRNLSKRPLFTFINLTGLTVGFCCAILLSLYIIDELRFDSFHSKADRIYRVTENIQKETGDRHVAMVHANFGPYASQNLAGVEAFTQIMSPGRITVGYEDFRSYEEIWLTNNEFFEVFDFEWLAGDRKDPLTDPKSVVLTERIARKYFGDENPVGKTLYTNITDVVVSGVIADQPANSHLQQPMYFSMKLGEQQFPWWKNWYDNDWSTNGLTTYLVLQEGTVAADLAARMTDVTALNREEDDKISDFALQSLSDIHFGSENLELDMSAHGSNIRYIYIFGAIGLLVLLVALINYVNLSTANGIKRAREVGMRKVIGASRKQLIYQFLGESLLLALLAVLLATALVQLILPWFNDIAGRSLGFDLLSSNIVLGLLAAATGAGLLAGSYPALYLSRFRPITVMKAMKSSGKGFSLRHGLVVAQFVASVVMISGTVMVYRQMQYVREMDLGYERSQLMVVDINSGALRSGYEGVKEAFLDIPGVEQVSASSRVPSEWKYIPTVGTSITSASGQDFNYISADEDFLKTFDIALTGGRNFTGMPADSGKILINETAATILGFGKDAIGQQVTINEWQENEMDEPVTVEVIGIVKDFNMESARKEILPMLIGFRKNTLHQIDYYTLRLSTDNITEVLAAVEETNNKFDPENPTEYNFLDDKFNELYTEDVKRGRIFGAVALVSVIIACLGLFALALFSTQQRIKEIGIRKVLGASVSGLAILISKEFLTLILLALLIATPLSWWLMNQWLQEFAFKSGGILITIVLTGIVTIGFAIFTVGFHTMKTAYINPVDTLRQE